MTVWSVMRRMPRRSTVVLVLAALGLVAGCATVVTGGSTDPGATGTRLSPSVVGASGKGASISSDPVVDAPLEGTQWYLRTAGAASGAAISTEGVDVEIKIQQGTAILASGCNPGSAQVSVDPPVASFGPVTLSSMSCLQDADTEMQETVRAFLSDRSLTYLIDGDQLTLTAGGQGFMVFSTRGGTSPVVSAPAGGPPDSTASLSGTWRVTRVWLARGGGEQVPTLPATITFGGPSGTVAFTTYCDKGAAHITAAGATLTFSAVRMPLNPCPSPPPGSAAGAGDPKPVAFIDWTQILAGPLHYVRAGQTLSLTGADGLVVNLTAAS